MTTFWHSVWSNCLDSDLDSASTLWGGSLKEVGNKFIMLK